MLMAPPAATGVEISKLADDNWNSCTVSCEKFIDEMPPLVSMLSEMFPPSTVNTVWLPAPRMLTVNSVLN